MVQTKERTIILKTLTRKTNCFTANELSVDVIYENKTRVKA